MCGTIDKEREHERHMKEIEQRTGYQPAVPPPGAGPAPSAPNRGPWKTRAEYIDHCVGVFDDFYADGMAERDALRAAIEVASCWSDPPMSTKEASDLLDAGAARAAGEGAPSPEAIFIATETYVRESAYLYERHTQTDEMLEEKEILDALAWRKLARILGITDLPGLEAGGAP